MKFSKRTTGKTAEEFEGLPFSRPRITSALSGHNNNRALLFSRADFCEYNTKNGRFLTGTQSVKGHDDFKDFPFREVQGSALIPKKNNSALFFSGHSHVEWNAKNMKKEGDEKRNSDLFGFDVNVNAVLGLEDVMIIFYGRQYAVWNGKKVVEKDQSIADKFDGLDAVNGTLVVPGDKPTVYLFNDVDFYKYEDLQW